MGSGFYSSVLKNVLIDLDIFIIANAENVGPKGDRDHMSNYNQESVFSKLYLDIPTNLDPANLTNDVSTLSQCIFESFSALNWDIVDAHIAMHSGVDSLMLFNAFTVRNPEAMTRLIDYYGTPPSYYLMNHILAAASAAGDIYSKTRKAFLDVVLESVNHRYKVTLHQFNEMSKLGLMEDILKLSKTPFWKRIHRKSTKVAIPGLDLVRLAYTSDINTSSKSRAILCHQLDRAGSPKWMQLRY